MKRKRVNLVIDIPQEMIDERMDMCDEEEAIEEIVAELMDVGLEGLYLINMEIVGETGPSQQET